MNSVLVYHAILTASNKVIIWSRSTK